MTDQTQQEYIARLYRQLAQVGHYPLAVLTVDDVLEHFEQDENPISRHMANEACIFVSQYWEDGPEIMSALEAVQDYVLEEQGKQ